MDRDEQSMDEVTPIQGRVREMSTSASAERGQQLEREIAVRAYERWIRRGRPNGDGLEDWFGAQAEIEAEHARKSHDRYIAIFAG